VEGWSRSRGLSIGGPTSEDGRFEEDVKQRKGLACAAFGGLVVYFSRKPTFCPHWSWERFWVVTLMGCYINFWMNEWEKIKKRRLLWFRHVERMEGERLPIADLHGHVEGKRSRGRQRKIWMDNVWKDHEGEKHRLDQDWRGNQKQRGLEESCKSLIVSSLMELGAKRRRCLKEWRVYVHVGLCTYVSCEYYHCYIVI